MSQQFKDIAVCVFDFDGTLVDSMGAFADLAGEIIERRRAVPFATARDQYRQTSGIPFFQQLEVLFPGHPDNPGTAEEFEERKLSDFFDEPYFPEVIDVLNALQHKGIRTAVSSNNFQENVDAFVARNPAPLDHVLGFREGFAKGADHFRELMQRENVTPQRILFVGDSLKDGEKAHASGVRFAGRTGTFSAQEFKAAFPETPAIATLSDLLVLIG